MPSANYGARLGAAGVVVIDDSAVFRMDPNVPLVVPEVNAAALRSMTRGIVAIQVYDDAAGDGAEAASRCGGDQTRRRHHLSVGVRHWIGRHGWVVDQTKH